MFQKRYNELIGLARQKTDEAKALLVEQGDGNLSEAETTRFEALMAEAEDAKARAVRLAAVMEQDRRLAELAPEEDEDEDEDGDERAGRQNKSFTPIYHMRFGEEDAARQAVLSDLVGRDYKAKIWAQNAAFGKYLREGERGLEREDVKLLRQQIFAFAQIQRMVHDGMSVAQMKATMVEAQGTLGGFAVPPNVQQEFISRLPGLTAVRGGGARVIELVNSNSIEAPEYTGGDARYRGNLRGAWGSETQAPAAKNATLGLKTITADVYTYKVAMSQSLVEDAANLIELVQADIIDTGALDEDDAFLVGDGVGKPLGMLPGSANGLSITEVNSGSAGALTAPGLRALKRGVASQYRGRGVFVANSDTYGAIERLRDESGGAGTGQFMFPDLTTTDMLLGRRTLESEALPDVAANAFVILFGDMSGYWIVQRMGMTIARYQDSATGPNVVEFHVRRRVGGRLVEPWKFAVQKVAA